jgi:hypothetical protein
MGNLNAAFEEVADWCERHLEHQRGPAVGLSFGAMLRAYGRLATLPARLHGYERTFIEKKLNDRAELLLLQLSAFFLTEYNYLGRQPEMVDGASYPANMIYDTGPWPENDPLKP